MMSDITEVIDDYCRSKYGHSNWAWYNEREHLGISNDVATVEGSIVFYFKPYEEEDDS
jgi:hypothetical protein